MSTTMTIPNSQSTFQIKSLASSPFISRFGAMSLNSIPRQQSRQGAAASMTCITRASGQNPHTLLGVAHGATKAEIKKAYRSLALQYHPDVCKGDHCSTHFQKIISAYEALMIGMATPPSAELEDDSSDDLEGFMGLDEELWEAWMGWEGAGTLDFSNPSDNAN